MSTSTPVLTRTRWCPCERILPDDPGFLAPGSIGGIESAERDHARDEEHRPGLHEYPGDTRDGHRAGIGVAAVGKILRASKEAPASPPSPRPASRVDALVHSE